MTADDLIAALSAGLPKKLAEDLAKEFLELRQDVATRTLGRAAPGKFVETTVQCLEALENGGTYSASPAVDHYLKGLESRSSTLPDGLRICAARIARAMYALRSKRNIVHKANIDPTMYDLRFLYAGAQWLLAELLSLTPGISGIDAAKLVAEVQLPVGELVEVLGGRRLVHADLRARDEALLVLMSYHPEAVEVNVVIESMDRLSPKTVRNALTSLWKEKLLHKPKSGEVVLTDRGLRAAIALAQAQLA